MAITKAFPGGGGRHCRRLQPHPRNRRPPDRAGHGDLPATYASGGTIHIEDIQDQVELSLMRAGEHKIARDYVIYREEQARKRAAKQALSPATQPPLQYQRHSAGRQQRTAGPGPHPHHRQRSLFRPGRCQRNRILDEALKNLYDGVTAAELSTSLVITARTMIEQEPNYLLRLAARLLCDNLRAEALASRRGHQRHPGRHGHAVRRALPAYIEKRRGAGTAGAQPQEFDLELLGRALLPERDLQFTYLGLQTLYDRYFIHSGEVRIELPQILLHARRHGLAAQEDDRNARAIEFYQLLSSFDYMSSTPPCSTPAPCARSCPPAT